MSLRALKIIFTVIAVVYVLLPTDLLPDLLGLLGRIDDIIVIGLLYWKYQDIAKKFVSKSTQKNTTQSEDSSHTKEQAKSKPRSPYEVLELEAGATKEQIEKQYKRLVAQYHPDKVNHLGEDLQKLAHEKMLAIQDAYEELTRR